MTVTLGDTIREARESKGWNQAELGEQLSPPVVSSTISRWELGQKVPVLGRLHQLADILGLPTETVIRQNTLSSKTLPS